MLANEGILGIGLIEASEGGKVFAVGAGENRLV